MNCPNCKQPFAEERPPKFLCSVCGWLEKIGKEWENCEAPESPPPQESPTAQELEPEPEPAAHEPDPAAHEPDPAAPEPDTNLSDLSVKKYLGGLLTVTEVDE